MTVQSARERHGGRFDRRKRRDRGGESSAAGAADEGGFEMVELAAHVQSAAAAFLVFSTASSTCVAV